MMWEKLYRFGTKRCLYMTLNLRKRNLIHLLKGKNTRAVLFFLLLSKYMYSRLNFCFRAIYFHINPSFIVQKFLIIQVAVV